MAPPVGRRRKPSSSPPSPSPGSLPIPGLAVGLFAAIAAGFAISRSRRRNRAAIALKEVTNQDAAASIPHNDASLEVSVEESRDIKMDQVLQPVNEKDVEDAGGEAIDKTSGEAVDKTADREAKVGNPKLNLTATLEGPLELTIQLKASLHVEEPCIDASVESISSGEDEKKVSPSPVLINGRVLDGACEEIDMEELSIGYSRSSLSESDGNSDDSSQEITSTKVKPSNTDLVEGETEITSEMKPLEPLDCAAVEPQHSLECEEGGQFSSKTGPVTEDENVPIVKPSESPNAELFTEDGSISLSSEPEPSEPSVDNLLEGECVHPPNVKSLEHAHGASLQPADDLDEGGILLHVESLDLAVSEKADNLPPSMEPSKPEAGAVVDEFLLTKDTASTITAAEEENVRLVASDCKSDQNAPNVSQNELDVESSVIDDRTLGCEGDLQSEEQNNDCQNSNGDIRSDHLHPEGVVADIAEEIVEAERSTQNEETVVSDTDKFISLVDEGSNAVGDKESFQSDIQNEHDSDDTDTDIDHMPPLEESCGDNDGDLQAELYEINSSGEGGSTMGPILDNEQPSQGSSTSHRDYLQPRDYDMLSSTEDNAEELAVEVLREHSKQDYSAKIADADFQQVNGSLSGPSVAKQTRMRELRMDWDILEVKEATNTNLQSPMDTDSQHSQNHSLGPEIEMGLQKGTRFISGQAAFFCLLVTLLSIVLWYLEIDQMIAAIMSGQES